MRTRVSCDACKLASGCSVHHRCAVRAPSPLSHPHSHPHPRFNQLVVFRCLAYSQRRLAFGKLLQARRKLLFTEPLARTLGLEATLRGHRGCVNRLAWSQDGTLLASGSDDRQACPMTSANPSAGHSAYGMPSAISAARGHTPSCVICRRILPRSAVWHGCSAAPTQRVCQRSRLITTVVRRPRLRPLHPRQRILGDAFSEMSLEARLLRRFGSGTIRRLRGRPSLSTRGTRPTCSASGSCRAPTTCSSSPGPWTTPSR